MIRMGRERRGGGQIRFTDTFNLLNIEQIAFIINSVFTQWFLRNHYFQKNKHRIDP
jgi:hypothetical protein